MASSRFERAARAVSRFALPTAATPRNVRALTAASSPAVWAGAPQGTDVLTPEALRAKTEGWQKRVLELADLVPEVAGTASLVGGSISRVKLRVEPLGGLVDSNMLGEMQSRLDALNVGRMGELLFLTGEAWIAWPELSDPYVLAATEVKANVEPKQARDASGAFQDLPPTTQLVRVWKESRSNRYQASSAHKSALNLIEAMYLHQEADTAVATSRLISAGILVWPTKRKAMGIDPETGAPYPGSQEEEMARFAQMAAQNLTNRSSIDSKTPFLLAVEPDASTATEELTPRMVRIDREDYAAEYATRFESYGLRYAKAVELPIEQSTGMGATNHWSAWSIREDSWRSYLAPIVELIVDALNERIANQFGMKVVPDAKDLITKPDQTSIIMQMLGLHVVTTDSAIQALQSSELNDLVTQDPPEQDSRITNKTVVDVPSDFQVNGDRGGGKFRG